jgi:hypothetical protein
VIFDFEGNRDRESVKMTDEEKQKSKINQQKLCP